VRPSSAASIPSGTLTFRNRGPFDIRLMTGHCEKSRVAYQHCVPIGSVPSSRGVLGSDAMYRCYRITTFRRTVLPQSYFEFRRPRLESSSPWKPLMSQSFSHISTIRTPCSELNCLRKLCSVPDPIIANVIPFSLSFCSLQFLTREMWLPIP
jgi:hypothetical protein